MPKKTFRCFKCQERKEEAPMQLCLCRSCLDSLVGSGPRIDIQTAYLKWIDDAKPDYVTHCVIASFVNWIVGEHENPGIPYKLVDREG